MTSSVDDVRSYIMIKPRVVEETPFGPEVLVYKILGKIFATLRFEGEVAQMNLKCDAERALQLRDGHDTILPGYHMNKKHWNTLILDGSLSSHLVGELIDHSYQLVVKGMPQKTREILCK
jgi:predicted DNA-binding protein (MmcQ/YjbR family)